MGFKPRKRKPPRKQRRGPKETKRTSMLNLHRLREFKYDFRHIMARSQMDETMVPTFMANLIAKASRVSIKEAKTYLHQMEDAEDIERDVAEDIARLLDRYTRYR